MVYTYYNNNNNNNNFYMEQVISGWDISNHPQDLDIFVSFWSVLWVTAL